MTAGGHREIQLTRGHVALVDAADFDWLSQWKWFACTNDSHQIYARCWANGAYVRMHRQIVGATPHQVVDHINRDTLDNRRANLRLCDHQENSWNRSKSAGCASPYKGVFRMRRRWRAQIIVSGKAYALGVYDTQEEAARAYDRAAVERHRDFAFLNFPAPPHG